MVLTVLTGKQLLAQKILDYNILGPTFTVKRKVCGYCYEFQVNFNFKVIHMGSPPIKIGSKGFHNCIIVSLKKL